MYWFNHALVHVLFSFVWKYSNHMTNIFSIFCLWLLFYPMIPLWGSWSCRRTNSSQSICLSCRPSQMRDRRTRQPVGVREFCSFFILFRIRRTILSFSLRSICRGRRTNQSINQSMISQVYFIMERVQCLRDRGAELGEALPSSGVCSSWPNKFETPCSHVCWFGLNFIRGQMWLFIFNN